jgi:hypothetical protein
MQVQKKIAVWRELLIFLSCQQFSYEVTLF